METEILFKDKIVPLANEVVTIQQLSHGESIDLPQVHQRIVNIINQLSSLLSDDETVIKILDEADSSDDNLVGRLGMLGSCWCLSLGCQSLTNMLSRQQDLLASDDFRKLDKQNQQEILLSYSNQAIGAINIISLQLSSLVTTLCFNLLIGSHTTKDDAKVWFKDCALSSVIMNLFDQTEERVEQTDEDETSK